MLKFAHTIFALSMLALFGFAATASVAEPADDTGSMQSTYTKRDQLPVPDREGHVLMLNESRGTAKNPGGQVDGYSVTVVEILDLTQGSGPQQGYVIFSKGDDQRVVKIDGMITTTMKDDQPNTTFEGKWEIVANSGALEGSEGEGTYTGYFTSEDSHHVDWQGKISGAKDAVAER
jgi:hypothetical protein